MIGWYEVGGFVLLGPEAIYVEKVRLIRDRLKAHQSQQKSYDNYRKRDLEFEISYTDLLKDLTHERYDEVLVKRRNLVPSMWALLKY